MVQRCLYRDVGFSGKTRAMVGHALQLLEKSITITSVESPAENSPSELFIKPKLTIPDVLNLVISGNMVCSSLSNDLCT